MFKRLRDRFRKKKPEEEEKAQESTSSAPGQISSKIRSYLEKELLVVRFLDWISEESFDFIFQKKIYDNYISTHTKDFLDVEKAHSEEKERVSKLKEEYDRLQIESAAFGIKERSEEVAKRNKIRGPYLKRFNRINLIIMGALIGTIFIFYIPALRPYQMYSFLLILPVCFLPNLIKKQMKKKWNEFKYMHREELQAEIYDEISKIKIFIQILLDDAREYMLEEQFPLQVLEFPLMSNDYTSLNLIRENIQDEQVQYVFQFEYPEGMEPFDAPNTMRSGGVGTATAVSSMNLSEDDENDLFLIVKNPQYNEDGILDTNNLDIVELGYKPIAETLLENSEFDKLKEPEKIIPDFDDFKGIPCTCGEPVSIGEIQKIRPRAHKDFKFYMMIGEKCEKCSSNPFILVPLPDMTIPEELADIFVDPIPMEAERTVEAVDLFSVIKEATYDEQKVLKLGDYSPNVLDDSEVVQDLLGNSTFKKLKDPTKRFSDFDEFQIPCGCEDTAKLVSVQLVTAKEHEFKYYLLMGEKCLKCNVEPFLLIQAPDQEIPEPLKEIF